MTPEQFIKMIEKIDKELAEKLMILVNNMPRAELLSLVSSDEFDSFINNNLGLSAIIDKFFNGINIDVENRINELSVQEERKRQVEDSINMIKNAHMRSVNSQMEANMENIRTTVIESVINGESGSRISDKLEQYKLSTAQINSLIFTSKYDITRSTTKQVYLDSPEQKFYYSGGVIPTSSDECRWLFNNQRKGGYTMEEIDSGIKTPFTYRYGDMKGKVKKIYWNGRQPNNNCIHEWIPIGL